eukprot:Selendium_serpulae@DN633_c0_g1_i2.p1
MRTAKDVISRLRYDADCGVDAAAVVVGYLDRYKGAVCRPFSSFDWDVDYFADADPSSDATVPQYRVEFFAWKEDYFLWNKKQKIDNVFASAPSDPQSAALPLRDFVARCSEDSAVARLGFFIHLVLLSTPPVAAQPDAQPRLTTEVGALLSRCMVSSALMGVASAADFSLAPLDDPAHAAVDPQTNVARSEATFCCRLTNPHHRTAPSETPENHSSSSPTLLCRPLTNAGRFVELVSEAGRADVAALLRVASADLSPLVRFDAPRDERVAAALRTAPPDARWSCVGRSDT